MPKSYDVIFASSNTHKYEEAKEILNSAHADIFERAWSNFLSGYKSSIGKERFAKITNKVMIIESRGRYARVV